MALLRSLLKCSILFFLFYVLEAIGNIYIEDTCWLSPSQYSSLESLYSSTSGDNWNYDYFSDSDDDQQPWSFSSDINAPCADNWAGIVCTCSEKEYRINILNLGQFGLYGTLPSTISGLSYLEDLDISNNHVTSTIPKEIGQLAKLIKIQLSHNLLVGTIPDELFNLPLLESIDIQSNYLNGTLSSTVCNMTILRFLSLNNNYFTGTIPQCIGDLTHMVMLSLPNNNFSGPIPSSVGSMSLLRYLYLNSNQLTGSIPSTFGDHNFFLLEAHFQDNNLIGTIPYGITNTPILFELILSYNKLNGTIPSYIGDRITLIHLSLNGNLFSGQIPSSMSRLIAMSQLDISNNPLTGSLPDMFSYMIALRSFSAANCQLEGSLPASFTSLQLLLQIDVHGNHLSGTLPSDIDLLSNLEFVYLNNNDFTGSLPSTMSSLTNLQEVVLNNNNLHGKIPFFDDSSTRYPQLTRLLLANNKLSGTLTNDYSKFPSLEELILSVNCLDGHINENIRVLNASLSILDLSSMGSANGCLGNRAIVQSRFTTHGLRGTIPSTIFTFPNLEIFQVQNGHLEGSLSDIPSSSKLQSFLVSNNYVSGKVPISMQRHEFIHFDLSYNKFNGELDNEFMVSTTQRTLKLSINRLSGRLPETLKDKNIDKKANLTDFDILEQNLFGCEYNDIPSKDHKADTYSCGSDMTTSQWFGVYVVSASVLIFIFYYVGVIYRGCYRNPRQSQENVEDNFFLDCNRSFSSEVGYMIDETRSGIELPGVMNPMYQSRNKKLDVANNNIFEASQLSNNDKLTGGNYEGSIVDSNIKCTMSMYKASIQNILRKFIDPSGTHDQLVERLSSHSSMNDRNAVTFILLVRNKTIPLFGVSLMLIVMYPLMLIYAGDGIFEDPYVYTTSIVYINNYHCVLVILLVILGYLIFFVDVFRYSNTHGNDDLKSGESSDLPSSESNEKTLMEEASNIKPECDVNVRDPSLTSEGTNDSETNLLRSSTHKTSFDTLLTYLRSITCVLIGIKMFNWIFKHIHGMIALLIQLKILKFLVLFLLMMIANGAYVYVTFTLGVVDIYSLIAAQLVFGVIHIIPIVFSSINKSFTDETTAKSECRMSFIILLLNAIVIPSIITILLDESCLYSLMYPAPSVENSITIEYCEFYYYKISVGLYCVQEGSFTISSSSQAMFQYSYMCNSAYFTDYTPIMIMSTILQIVWVLTQLHCIVRYPNFSLDCIEKWEKLKRSLTDIFCYCCDDNISKNTDSVIHVRATNIITLTLVRIVLFFTFGVAVPLFGILLTILICIDIFSNLYLILMSLDQSNNSACTIKFDPGYWYIPIRQLTIITVCFLGIFWGLVAFDKIADVYGNIMGLIGAILIGIVYPVLPLSYYYWEKIVEGSTSILHSRLLRIPWRGLRR